MAEIMDELGEEDFVRVHKSYVVALKKIMDIKTVYPYIKQVRYGDM